MVALLLRHGTPYRGLNGELGFRYGRSEIRRMSLANRPGIQTWYSPPMKRILGSALFFNWPAAFPIYPHAPVTSSIRDWIRHLVPLFRRRCAHAGVVAVMDAEPR